MQRFDCLTCDCPLLGFHLLEASAGTGKTFSIEHIYVRLVLESLEVEQILAVTFTRAAARELKTRIRARLEKALALIQAKEPTGDYLSLYFGSEEAIHRLTDALATFDRCQIFTIHGFCYRILKEFAFEAKVGSLSDPDEGKKNSEKLRQAVFDFLENGIEETILCAKQLVPLLKQFKSVEQIIEKLLEIERKETEECKAALHLNSLEGVFSILRAAWNPIAEKLFEQEENLNPDEILIRMRRAIESETFADLVHRKYSAVVVDEFQDTDAMQWEIFRRLFLEKPVRALYLVGDPKQSIYRFRKADVYTYLKARDLLGEKNLYYLDTNFRSSKDLIGALNALFSREWLHLPKEKRTLPYHPVKAGTEIDTYFPDGKGALHFFLAEGEPNSLFDRVFLPFTAGEIERLQLKKCALLVKDRYQAEKALDFLGKRGITAIAKSHIPLGKTAAFRAIWELFEAVWAPRDANAAKIVMAGPFAKPDFPFLEYRVLLEEKGLVPFARELNLDIDAMQIFEVLFAWEKKEGFSFEGLKRFLKTLPDLGDEEGGKRRMEVDEEAVQIMTLHISKGLEFDVVFALGLASRTPKGDEELDAEKQRQLYVAMTRAKKRLYVPIALSQKDPESGTHSPIELFSRHFEGSFLDQLTVLARTESITFERLSSPLILGPPAFVQKMEKECRAKIPPHSFTPSFLSSFTTLAKPQETSSKPPESDPTQFTIQTMPRGSDTGIVIHRIFEVLFGSPRPVWRDFSAIDALVAEQLRFSPLAHWKEAIQQMVRQIVIMPLQADGEFFSLSEIERFQVEAEFLFSSPPNFVKGFIDLIFYYRNRVYLLDWKTNWLEDYSPASLRKAMESNDYGLQAALYTEAIKRHFKAPFGGAFYLFVRGGAYFWIA